MNKKIKKVPMVMQLEALECWAACLTMILAYYGKWLPLEQVRKDSGVSRNGLKAINIVKAAKNYGLEASGYKFGDDYMNADWEFPCIIHWNFNHFVVLTGFKNNYAVINDPARGVVKVALEEFDKSFTGVCLQLRLGENFKPEGKPNSIFEFAKKRLKGASGAVIFMALAAAVSAVFAAVNPLMSKVFIDKVLNNSLNNNNFIIALCLLGELQLAALFTQSLAALKINAKLAVTGSTNYMWHVLRLPLEFFSQRMPGELQLRQEANASVAYTLVNIFAPILINALMTVIYLVLMLKYSLWLSIIVLLAVLINIFISHIAAEKRVNAARAALMNAGKFYQTTISGFQMIETIKATGAENGFFQKWAGYQAAFNNSTENLIRVAAGLGKLPEFIAMLLNALIVALGVMFIMQNNFTIGMLLTFQGLMLAFMQPVQMMIEAGETLHEMRTDSERIEDVMEYPVDNLCAEHEVNNNINYQKLSGNVELKNITFGYARLEEPLIKNFSFKIKQGTSVAFVGASVCGKSTLSKLISGLYTPWDGEILFDNKKISDIDRSVFTGSLAVVDQDIIIFEDTIAANIKMWDESIENFEMILAARDAQIHDDIVLREGGYNYKLTEGGRNLSGGQRQRLEIARVLAQDPSIIILDEATSALDAKTESAVVNAIKARGITCIVIAHRLSTIRDCDEIIVINKGEAAERGTHDELMKLDGLYKKLVVNE